jgi:hypothetical protein
MEAKGRLRLVVRPAAVMAGLTRLAITVRPAVVAVPGFLAAAVAKREPRTLKVAVVAAVDHTAQPDQARLLRMEAV